MSNTEWLWPKRLLRTTTIPLTMQPTVDPQQSQGGALAGAVRITRGTRQGWQLTDRSIVWDDGEKEVPASGLSDAEKRDAALKAALGELPALHEGAASADIDKLRTETTRVASGDDIDAARRRVAKEIAALPPTSDATVSEKRARSLPPSAEEQLQKLRATGRALVEAEVTRVEELKQLAIGHNLVVGRDGGRRCRQRAAAAARPHPAGLVGGRARRPQAYCRHVARAEALDRYRSPRCLRSPGTSRSRRTTH